MADGGRRSPQPDKLSSIPLPLGWESKYDFAQKRYFFIDHKNKTTSWEDPRIKLLEKQQQPQHVAGYHPVESQNLWHMSEDYRSSRASPTPMKTSVTPAKSTGGGWQSQIEDKYGMKVEILKEDTDVDPDIFRRITSHFPTAGKDLICMVMNDSASEEAVYQKLHEMGYKEQKPILGSDFHLKSTSSSPSHQEKPSTGFTIGLPKTCAKNSGSQPASPGHKLEPGGKPSIPSDVKRTSPERSMTPKNVLSNSAERRSASPGRQSKEKGSGHRSHHSSKASPLAELTHDKKKRMREKLEHEFKNLEKSAIESTLSVCAYDEEKTRLALQLQVVAKTFTAAANQTGIMVSGHSGTNEANKNSAEGLAPASSGSGKSTDAMTKATMDNANDQVNYTSALRQETKGPDPSLAKGPNKQLLLSQSSRQFLVESVICVSLRPTKNLYRHNSKCSKMQKSTFAMCWTDRSPIPRRTPIHLLFFVHWNNYK